MLAAFFRLAVAIGGPAFVLGCPDSHAPSDHGADPGPETDAGDGDRGDDDGGVDIVDAADEPIEDAWTDFVGPEAFPDVTGRLVAEPGDGTLVAPESGRLLHTRGLLVSDRLSAFSGTVYGLTGREEDETTGSTFYAVYRFDPVRRELTTVHVDPMPAGADFGPSVCWTGELFLAARTTVPRGDLTLLAVSEAGTVVRDPEVIPSVASDVLLSCPSLAAPFIVEGWLRPPTRIHPIGRDGSLDGPPVDVVLPPLEPEGRCADTNDELVCVGGEVVVFIGRDGSVRVSDPIALPPPSGFPENATVGFTGDSVTVWWSADPVPPTRVAYVAFAALDGRLLLPASPIAFSPGRLTVASSGVDVLAILALGLRPWDGVPQVLLVDLDGIPLDAPVPLTTLYTIFDNPIMGACWEGDAYGVLWNTRPDGRVLYRRFSVAP